jgi:hypothetical protein
MPLQKHYLAAQHTKIISDRRRWNRGGYKYILPVHSAELQTKEDKRLHQHYTSPTFSRYIKKTPDSQYRSMKPL